MCTGYVMGVYWMGTSGCVLDVWRACSGCVVGVYWMCGGCVLDVCGRVLDVW